MLLLEAYNIKKYYGDRLILDIPELRLYAGNRVGIVGLNGVGKTTLMNILSGDAQPDEGYVVSYASTAYIRQFSEEDAQADTRMLNDFGAVGLPGAGERSGGEQTRIRIANALCKNAALVFADEPTSNLDARGIELLGERLSRTRSLVIISHDRALLDMLCNKILELRDSKNYWHEGNYSDFLAYSGAEREKAFRDYERYADERSRLERAAAQADVRAKSIRKAPKRMGNSEARLHRRAATEIAEKLHGQSSAISSRLEKLEVKEKPRKMPAIRMNFSLTNPPENKLIVNCERFAFGYGEKTLFADASFNIPRGSKTAIVGDNGTGKTTLLRQIYENNAAFRIAPKARLGFFYQNFENMDFDKSVLDNVMDTSVQNENTVRLILARLLIRGDDVYKKAALLSGGERIKLSFAKLITSASNVLLLDEPTNYLDISSIEALQVLLHEYEGTVIFVSHDRAFVDAVADRRLRIENCVIAEE